MLRCVFLAVSAMLLVACATITRGTTQVVAVDTPGAPGTSCTIQTQNGPQVVTTPGSVTLSRGSSSLPIQCTKECYLLGSSIIPSNAEKHGCWQCDLRRHHRTWGRCASGAMNKYPTWSPSR